MQATALKIIQSLFLSMPRIVSNCTDCTVGVFRKPCETFCSANARRAGRSGWPRWARIAGHQSLRSIARHPIAVAGNSQRKLWLSCFSFSNHLHTLEWLPLSGCEHPGSFGQFPDFESSGPLGPVPVPATFAAETDRAPDRSQRNGTPHPDRRAYRAGGGGGRRHRLRRTCFYPQFRNRPIAWS